jgi:hypothetical protein
MGWVAVFAGSVTAIGCTGSIGSLMENPAGGPGATTSGGEVGQTGSGAVACNPTTALSPPRLWRLNDQQYANVVHDVFGAGITVPPDVSAAVVPGAEDASSSSGLRIADLPTVQSYQRAAQKTAASAVANLSVLLSCPVPDASCVESFIRTKIARAFRRPVTDQQVSDMLGIYQLGASDGVSAGVEGLLQYVLQAPAFLWRSELTATDPAAPPLVRPLGSFELASSVSFLFADSAPDDELWSKAVDGSITQPQVLASQVDRLLTQDKVKQNLANKVGSWLSIRKTEVTAKMDPAFTADVKTSLAESARMFLQDIVSSGTLTDLVTSRRMYMNESLSTLYQVGTVTGSALVPVDAKQPQWSGGILTQPALLAALSHPSEGDVVHRGLFIYNSMACGTPIPAPPAGATAINAALPADATQRQRAAFRAGRSDCHACHARFDPFGLLSERYDFLGRYSTTDASGHVVDQTSTIAVGSTSLDGPANGLPDLITRLTSSRDFADCVSDKLANIALGRDAAEDDSCAMRKVKDDFATGPSFLALFRALATSPAFALRDDGLK